MSRIEDIMNEISPARMRKVILQRKIRSVLFDFVNDLITLEETQELLTKIAEEYVDVLEETVDKSKE